MLKETIMSDRWTVLAAWLVLALGALGAAGCATTAAPAQRAATPLPGTDACVFIRNVYDWDVVDPSTLIVYAPMRKDPYLVKLFEPVFDLDFRQRVGFEDGDHSGMLCGNGAAYLVVRDEIGPQRVPIVAFRKLTVEQAKQLLPRGKRPASAAGQPAASQPAAGQAPSAASEAGKN
jgi:hypothetical protein